MEPGNVAAIFLVDGIPRILMTMTGLSQERLQTMVTKPGEKYLV